MHHESQRDGSVRKSLRPSLEMVERRRREQSEERGAAWWPQSASLRAAAASILGFFSIAVCVGLIVSTDASGMMSMDPAYAAVESMSFREHDHRRVVSAVTADRNGRQLPGRRIEKRRLQTHAQAVTRREPTPEGAPSATPSPPSPPSPTAPTAPPAPASMLTAQAWKLTADGTWTTVASLAVPAGANVARLNVKFSSDAADVLALDNNAQLAPGAIVTVGYIDHPLRVVAASADAAVGTQTADLAQPPSDTASFAAVAQAIGPHLVSIGWAPLAPSAGVQEFKIYRRAARTAHGALVGTVSPGGHSYHDSSVVPGTSYKYTVVASLAGGALDASAQFVVVPPSMQAAGIDAVSGKGMFLYFTPNTAEANGYDKYDPAAIVARATASGISHIEVRMARGTFVEADTPGARAWLDALIDRAAAAGIKLIAWHVPRRATGADAAAAVAAARYQTPAGNGFAGLALDIEDGENYMGFGAQGKQRMVDHIEAVRQAVGPGYLLVATVMSPALTHWTNERYPFARIAPFASVMQPMEYWHHFYSSTRHAYTQDEVTSACADSVLLTRKAAGRDIPINVAGQSDDLGTTGPPSPDEIAWCLAGSKGAGAIGQTFFDWRGTNDQNWAAIAGYAW